MDLFELSRVHVNIFSILNVDIDVLTFDFCRFLAGQIGRRVSQAELSPEHDVVLGMAGRLKD